jgi:D-xylose transport system substrate-binding protein
MQRVVTDGGGLFLDFDANLSNTQQLTDVQTLINQGADVIVLLAQDDKAGAEVVKLAADNNIPVIAYDRLIEDPSVLYLSFNNTDVGVAEATEMLKKVPPGTADKPANYVLIKGDPGDANAKTFLPAGWDQAGLKAAVDAGTIKILADQFTDAWDTTKAQNNMEAIIDAANASGDKIDAILAENDSTALGVAAALKNKSYGNVPISGQDGDTANLQNVAAGIQYVDVWKDSNQLGKAAGAAALQLCEGKTIAEVAVPDGVLDAASAPDNLAVQDFTTPGGNTVKSLILKVQPITQENLQKILDAKWLTKEVLCKNATDPATAAPVCK